PGKVPEEVVVAIDVDAWAGRGARRRSAAILSPHGVGVHTVLAPVRVRLREDEDVERVHDRQDVGGREGPATEGQAGAALVGLFELFDKVDEDVGAAPFSRVHPAEKVDSRTGGTAAVADLNRVAGSTFPGGIRQCEELGESGERRGSRDR